jgi:hypothetical protein
MLTTNVNKDDMRFKLKGEIDGDNCTVNGTVINENIFVVLAKLVEA